MLADYTLSARQSETMPSWRLSLKKSRSRNRLQREKEQEKKQQPKIKAAFAASPPPKISTRSSGTVSLNSKTKSDVISRSKNGIDPHATLAGTAISIPISSSPAHSASSVPNVGPNSGSLGLGLCPVCNLSIAHLLVLEQEVHVNNCLDVRHNDEVLALEREARTHRSSQSQSLSSGSASGNSRSSSNSGTDCDRGCGSKTSEYSNSTLVAEVPGRVWCPVCDADLSTVGLTQRVEHTEKCMETGAYCCSCLFKAISSLSQWCRHVTRLQHLLLAKRYR